MISLEYKGMNQKNPLPGKGTGTRPY